MLDLTWVFERFKQSASSSECTSMVASSFTTVAYRFLICVWLVFALAVLCGGIADASNATVQQQIELGNKLRREGRLTEVVQLMDKALASNPNSVASLLLRTAAFEAMGNLEAACTDAKRIAQLEPKSAANLARVGYYLARQGKFSQGLALCTQAVASDPHSAEAYAVRSGVYRLRPGHIKPALADARKAMELAPSVPNYATAYAYLLADCKQRKQAVAVLNQVLSTHKDFEPALCLRAQLESNERHFDLAERDWARACALEQSDTTALTGYASFLLERRRFAEAINLYTKTLENNPKNCLALKGRAYIYANSKRGDLAVSDLEVALATLAAQPYASTAVETSFLADYMDYLLRFHQWKNGLSFCTEKLAKSNLSPDRLALFHKYRGQFLYLLKDYAAALQEFSSLNQNGKVSLKDPFDATYVLALDALGRSQEALAKCRYLLKVNRNSWFLNETLHRLERNKTRPGDTLDSLDALIGLRPDSRELHEDRAKLLIKQSKYDSALAEYDLLIKTWPAHSKQYRTRKAKLYEVLGKDALALEEYNRMIERCTDDPELFISRAAIYKRLGDNQRSIQDRSLADALMAK